MSNTKKSSASARSAPHPLFWIAGAALLLGLQACANLPDGDAGNSGRMDGDTKPVLPASPKLVTVPSAATPAVAAAATVPTAAAISEAASLLAAAPAAVPADALATPSIRPRFARYQDIESTSLWGRIRSGYAMPDLQGDLVAKWERHYGSQPEYVQRMMDRSSRYLFHIVEEVEKRGLPSELALLPFAESAFNPQAMSSAKASGMWQFMPLTGKDFDLRQNLFRDDRRDVLASTRAALDYLEMLYKTFGDWHLALAAYNWGQGNVARAVKFNASRGLDTAYVSLAMPAETRNYVPKLQAIKNLVTAPANLGLKLPTLLNHPYFLSVSIDRDIDVARAASLAGLPLEEFQALNPQMNKPVILAAGTPRVLLPYDNANRFLRELPQARLPLASWTAWTAPRTLNPADAAKMVGMSEAQLREVNLIPARMLVKAGSTLLVPRSAKSSADVAEHVADNASLALMPEGRPLRRVAVRAAKRGETLAALAKRHGVSASLVAELNKVAATSSFKPGQTVYLMLPDKSPSRRAQASKSPGGNRTVTAQKRSKASTAAATQAGTTDKRSAARERR